MWLPYAHRTGRWLPSRSRPGRVSHEVLDGHKTGLAARQTRMRILGLLVENTEKKDIPLLLLYVVVVQLLSYVQLFVTLWIAAHQASLSLIIS